MHRYSLLALMALSALWLGCSQPVQPLVQEPAPDLEATVAAMVATQVAERLPSTLIPTPPPVPTPAPTVTPTPVPTLIATPIPTPSLPATFETYADPQGWSILVPSGWRPTTRQGQNLLLFNGDDIFPSLLVTTTAVTAGKYNSEIWSRITREALSNGGCTVLASEEVAVSSFSAYESIYVCLVNGT